MNWRAQRGTELRYPTGILTPSKVRAGRPIPTAAEAALSPLPELTTSPMTAPAPAPPAVQSATACPRDHPRGTQHDCGAMLPKTAPAAAPISPPRMAPFAADRRWAFATPAIGLARWVRTLSSDARVNGPSVQSSTRTVCIVLPDTGRKSFMGRARVLLLAGGRPWAARAIVPHINSNAHCRYTGAPNRIWNLTLLQESVTIARSRQQRNDGSVALHGLHT